MKCAIFDLDGTLADTSRDLLAAANAIFAAEGHGEPLSHERDAATALRGGRAMLTAGAARLGLGWDAAAITARYQPLLEAYGANIDRHTVLYPGVATALERLSGQGWRLGICTNKPEGLAETLVSRLGIRPIFGALIGADTLPTRKPDAAPVLEAIRRAGGDRSRSVLVGDTITDREASRAAGIPSILVTFGPDGAEVARHEPEALLEHFDRLDEVLARLVR